MSSSVTLTRVEPADATLQDNLWQFYEFESSVWSHADIDGLGRFNSLAEFLARLGDPQSFDWAYLIRQQDAVVGFLLVGHQNLDGRSIMEFADVYVLPKFRGQGVATEVLRQTVLASDHAWLICAFRDDQAARAFWARAFERLPFGSVREVIPSDVPQMHQFVVNDDGPA